MQQKRDETIRVAVADDHPIVRDGLRLVLGGFADIEVVAAAGSMEDVLSNPAPADVLLLDLDLDGVDASASIPQIVARGTRVVAFTAYGNRERVSAAIRAGAAGYVLKGAAAQDIAGAVRDVHAGRTYLDPRIGWSVIDALRGQATPITLTPRQSDVLQAMADGLATREIAARLGLSERTVKFHVTALFNRLGADNRAQAVAIAARLGLL